MTVLKCICARHDETALCSDLSYPLSDSNCLAYRSLGLGVYVGTSLSLFLVEGKRGGVDCHEDKMFVI